MINKNIFRTVHNEKIDDINLYIKNYIEKTDNSDNIEIWIGSDSQVYKSVTKYTTAICLYNKGKGGHVLLFKEYIKTPDFHTRLWREVEMCKETCMMVDEFMKINNICNDIIPCLDISPNPKFKSNILYNAALGYMKGCGFNLTKGKPGALASIIADHYVKK